MASNRGKWFVLQSINTHTSVVTINIKGNHIPHYGVNSNDTDYCSFQSQKVCDPVIKSKKDKAVSRTFFT